MRTRPWPQPGALLVAFLATCAQVPWRPDALYAGGADPVVVAKAALTLTALGIGVLLVRSRTERYPVPAAPFLFVSAFLGCSVLGAAADGRLVPTAVLSVRVILVLLIVAVLVRTYAVRDVLHAFVVVFAILVIAATLTTLALGTTGRLHGGLPPLHANELASLTVICLIWVVGRLFRGEDRPWSLLFIPACIAIIVLTQSRTSLIAGFAALVVVTLFATRVRVGRRGGRRVRPAAAPRHRHAHPGRRAARDPGRGHLAPRDLRRPPLRVEGGRRPGQSFSHQWFGGGLSQKTIQVVGPAVDRAGPRQQLGLRARPVGVGRAGDRPCSGSCPSAPPSSSRRASGAASSSRSSSSSRCAASSRAACSTRRPRSSSCASWPSPRSSSGSRARGWPSWCPSSSRSRRPSTPDRTAVPVGAAPRGPPVPVWEPLR